jgi:hypothetical protein
MKRIFVFATASNALVACGAHEPAPVAGPSAAVGDCGTFTLDQGEELPDAAARCLVGAAEPAPVPQ